MFINFVFTEGRWNEKLFKSNIPSKNGILKIIHLHITIPYNSLNQTILLIPKSNPTVIFIPH